MTNGSRHQQRGFSLLEIAIVLAILGFVLTIGLKSTGAYLSAERRQTTVARLAGIDAALVNYVALQRRLPCPADGTIAAGGANAGVELRTPATGVCTAIVTGVVPWVTLGLSESEGQDGWSGRISYRTISAVAVPPAAVNLGFTSNQALDMTNCDPAGAAVLVARTFAAQSVLSCVANLAGVCDLNNVAGCTSPLNFLLNRGIAVRDTSVAGNLLMDPASGNGAAYVLISHGENRAGGYSNAGVIQAASGAYSANEQVNRNNLAIQGFYVDAAQNDSTDPVAHFDDLMLRPSLMSVVTRAQLGPRAHLQ